MDLGSNFRTDSFSPQDKEMEISTGIDYDCCGAGRIGGAVGGKGTKYGSY